MDQSEDTEALVDRRQVSQYFETLFGQVEWEQGDRICIRGIGEKGTRQEGSFREELFLDPQEGQFMDEIMDCVIRWSEHQVASFVVPCVLKADRATADNVRLMTSVLVDIDSGNTDEKMGWLRSTLGEPNMVIRSGGIADGKTPKRHAYWMIDPSGKISQIVELRGKVAAKCGGDMMLGLGRVGNPLGRCHQPIRIPGSIHAKHGKRSQCSIEKVGSSSYSYSELDWSIITADPMPGVSQVAKEILLGFSPRSGIGEKAIESTLTSDVREGGNGEKNRWTEFTRTAGHYVHCARQGLMTLDDARADVYGWVSAHMHPPWPDDRIEKEWSAVVRIEEQKHGPIIDRKSWAEQAGATSDLGLAVWAPCEWAVETPPPRKFLVDGLLMAEKHQMMAADGGVGKTFLLLDLCTKIACAGMGMKGLTWCGQEVLNGGTAVLITTEDDMDEIHRRLHDMDLDKLFLQAKHKLIILPTIQAGGAFTLCASNGETSSPQWEQMIHALKKIDDLALVCIDTLNSTLHGDENSANVINQYIRQLTRISGECGAAGLTTHHIRKTMENTSPIRNLDDMKAAIRGSSALVGAFRSILGLWHCSDYERRMEGMGEEPKEKMVYRMGVCKANSPGMFEGTKTLLRNKSGMLHDCTTRDKYSEAHAKDTQREREAWMLIAIERGARNGHPYSNQSKNASRGLYTRRAELPEGLQSFGYVEFQKSVRGMLKRGYIVLAGAKGSANKMYLDVPDGKVATDSVGAELDSGAYTPPDWSEFVFDEQSGKIIHVPGSSPGKQIGLGSFRK